MIRLLFASTTLVGIALVISFTAIQNGSSPADQAEMAPTENPTDIAANTYCNALNFGFSSSNCKYPQTSATPIFKVTELRHYLCALEVKKRHSNATIVEESAVACTKTIPEYLAEPTCK
jgi:hypothetical protein